MGKTISPILDESGNLLTDINDIRKEWNSYYAELYAFRGNSDKEFASFVNKKVELIYNQVSDTAELEDGPITIEEFKREIRNLKKRKAPGWDMITDENLKHSGQLTLAAVTWAE